jgi:hypothetical protein
MNKRTWNWGRGNVTADRDVIFQMFMTNPSDVFKKFFESADQRFKAEIASSGQIFRISGPVDYSSEALVSSLMQLGLPLDVAVQVPMHMIDILKDIADEKTPEEPLSTADIRGAVVRCLELLQDNGRFATETVEIWRAAYIRRYGNPDNQFVKVVDRGVERDLNFEYITSDILPHLLCRIFGLPREKNPVDLYAGLFTNSRLGEMAKEIIQVVNTLNLYNISYKTLLLLVQDIVLEPPHPWMVSERTIDRALRYNTERMQAHLLKIRSPEQSSSQSIVTHAYQEFFRHASAAILSRYGAFLGIGSRYGLTELVRTLGLKKSNLQLWSFCRISSLEKDLLSCGTTISDLSRTARRVQGAFATPAPNSTHLQGLASAVDYFEQVVLELERSASATSET